MLKQLALAAIGLYQRHVSPRKGFSCAYRVRTEGMGCSGFGKHAIGKHGLLLGLVLLHRRFAKCAWHAHSKAPVPSAPRSFGPYGRQAGFADCDVGGCDGPDCSGRDCDMPNFGCCGKAAKSGAGDSCWIFSEICGSSGNSGRGRNTRSCAGPDCCNSSSGTKREEKRLARIQKRREKANRKDKSSKDSDDGFDGFDGGDSSDD